MADWASKEKPDVIVLFDVDGTLTPARQTISEEMLQALANLRKKVVIGFVGGSDLVKQKEQIGENAVDLFDFAFSENGLTAFRLGKALPSQSFINFLGEDRYKRMANFILRYIAELDIPKKRGTFIEFRNGMINVSPIGRNCTIAERNEFEEYDKAHNIRPKLVETLKAEFADYDLTYSIGGQISFDVFPTGWDKTYCLRHLANEGFKEIHFFGDKTFKNKDRSNESQTSDKNHNGITAKARSILTISTMDQTYTLMPGESSVYILIIPLCPGVGLPRLPEDLDEAVVLRRMPAAEIFPTFEAAESAESPYNLRKGDLLLKPCLALTCKGEDQMLGEYKKKSLGKRKMHDFVQVVEASRDRPFHVNAVRIEGAKASSTQLFQKSIGPILNAKTLGDILNASQYAAQRLSRLGVFKDIRIKLDTAEDSDGRDLDVILEVDELPRIFARTSTSVGTNEGDVVDLCVSSRLTMQENVS
ncbi:Phosphomannomutase [Phlyctochytrium bullatum]|nr:Phosphomannomutase [Phlyctochytrium bullatum]